MEGARDVLVQPCRLGEVEYNNPFNGWGEMGNRGVFFPFFFFLDFVAKGRGRGEEVRRCACDNAARRSCHQSRGGRLTTVDLPA